MTKSSACGFTLLEVMVALMIMAVLSLLTAQAMKSAIQNKSFVSREIARDSSLADTIRLIRADVAAAFHYQNVFCKMDNDLRPTPAPQAPGAPPAAPVAQGTPKPCPVDVTGFIGTADAMYFTSLANIRTTRDVQESDQAKIGYFLKSCKSRTSNANTQCLYRSISPFLDEELDKPANDSETVLLENVDEFKLRYLGPKKDDYQSSWKTGKDGDDITKVNFPYAVEITLTVLDKNNPKDHPNTTTVLAPIYFENNPKKPSTAQPTPAPGGGVPPVPPVNPLGGKSS